MFQSSDGTKVDFGEDYVPDFLCPDDDGYGDYMDMRINANGFIEGWDKEDAVQFIKDNISTNQNIKL